MARRTTSQTAEYGSRGGSKNLLPKFCAGIAAAALTLTGCSPESVEATPGSDRPTAPATTHDPNAGETTPTVSPSASESAPANPNEGKNLINESLEVIMQAGPNPESIAIANRITEDPSLMREELSVMDPSMENPEMSVEELGEAIYADYIVKSNANIQAIIYRVLASSSSYTAAEDWPFYEAGLRAVNGHSDTETYSQTAKEFHNYIFNLGQLTVANQELEGTNFFVPNAVDPWVRTIIDGTTTTQTNEGLEIAADHMRTVAIFDTEAGGNFFGNAADNLYKKLQDVTVKDRGFTAQANKDGGMTFRANISS